MTFFAGSDPGGKRTHHVPLIGGLSPPRILDRVVQSPSRILGVRSLLPQASGLLYDSCRSRRAPATSNRVLT